MNTERSDRLADAWRKEAHTLQRASATCAKRFEASPERIFPLLCPTTEYDWIPGWTAELLHSKSGYAEHNAIFHTGFFSSDEIWVCTRFEPNRIIEYSSTSQDVCNKVDIRLDDHCDGTTTGTWVVTFSALTESGNASVAAAKSLSQHHLKLLLDALTHYLTTGEMAG
jgi:hypothetical protein